MTFIFMPEHEECKYGWSAKFLKSLKIALYMGVIYFQFSLGLEK